MASTSSLYSPIQSFDPFSRARPAIKTSSNTNLRRRIYASRREARNHNSSVDENLIVLRKRIHEMKMMETSHELPSEWMDWEKQFYATYDPIICDAMGHLQSYLMETRPIFAIGMFVFIALSVPTSTAVVMYNLFQLSKGVLAGIHLG